MSQQKRFHLEADAIIEAEDLAQALESIVEHFQYIRDGLDYDPAESDDEPEDPQIIVEGRIVLKPVEND